MGDLEDRLKRAVERGTSRAREQEAEARQKRLSEEELKTLHTKYRLLVSEHIEQGINQLPQHFPGFRYETIYGERGWGAACSRDDFAGNRGGRKRNDFSRLELTVRPFSNLYVLELAGKGTIRNKEVFNRNFFEELTKVDPQKYLEFAEAWIVEYAEMYAASL